MVTIQDVNGAIVTGQFTNEQLDSIVMAVKYARNQLARSTRRSLCVGGQVRFFSSRQQRDMQGAVLKIGRKNVTVDCGTNGRWRVPATMLEVA